MIKRALVTLGILATAGTCTAAPLVATAAASSPAPVAASAQLPGTFVHW